MKTKFFEMWLWCKNVRKRRRRTRRKRRDERKYMQVDRNHKGYKEHNSKEITSRAFMFYREIGEERVRKFNAKYYIILF